MSVPFAFLLIIHLACAFGATLVFWVAAMMPKGRASHRASGTWFARLIYTTAVIGGVLAVFDLVVPTLVRPIDPALDPAVVAQHAEATRRSMWLVLYVLLIIVAPVQHGLATIAAGPVPSRVRSRLHATLSLASMIGSVALFVAALLWHEFLYLIVVPIGFIVGLRNMTYASRRSATPVQWQREHLVSLITSGITLHTAFFVFATSRTLQWQLSGWQALLPWTVPALVGVASIAWALRVKTARPTKWVKT